MQEDEAELGRTVIKAAKNAGVSFVTYVSCFHSQISALAHHHHKLLVEEALIESGLAYTILQPSMFMQNLFFVLQDVKTNGVVRWPWDPNVDFRLVDVDDLAAVIVRALVQRDLVGGTFEICGPQLLSVADTAAILGELLGKPVVATRHDRAVWSQGMRAMGMSDWGVGNMLAMSDHGLTGGNSLVLDTLLGRAATDYRTFAARVLSEHGG
jgi:uncharacterized protein YbjT (DUF2867 family)